MLARRDIRVGHRRGTMTAILIFVTLYPDLPSFSRFSSVPLTLYMFDPDPPHLRPDFLFFDNYHLPVGTQFVKRPQSNRPVDRPATDFWV